MTTTDTPDDAELATLKATTWAKVVEQALAMESKADAFGLLQLIVFTKGRAGVVVDLDGFADHLDLTPGSARHLLSRLEEPGWLDRRAELVDRKPVLRYVTTTAVR